MKILLSENKKIYFASDNHLGAPTFEASLLREKKFVAWLEQIKHDAGAIFLLGDLFDFWFEYQKVVPKGFVRVLGKLAELTDSGIPIYFFVGNHDLWMSGYFQKELNIPVFHKPLEIECNGKLFLIGHGDGLGPGDKGYKRMKRVFTNPFSKWLFRWLHPDIGVSLAQYLSVKNKMISGAEDVKYLGEDKEWLVQYAKGKLKLKKYDYFIFGHRHLPLKLVLEQQALYVNLGDWVQFYTYAEFDGKNLELQKYELF
ncbi:MAG: UDP-2,3-diacylglucosamine diphosphatase [Bacteroidota bacterium]|nr:UDP-2,3-diacylglucosamine diphosphatase [Bacteroidota bacterium]